MLEVKKLSKYYKLNGKEEVCALEQVSFRLPKTGFYSLLGKSGSGKSTLLHILGGLDEPTEGKVYVGDRSLTGMPERELDAYRNTCVGFVFQDSNLLEHLTVEENIGLALEMQGEKVSKEQIENVLEQVELSGYEKRKIGELSGGQRQRVAVARALIKNPQMILADEPTGALDSQMAEQLFSLLKKLSKEKLVLVATHDREAAETYSDGILELQDGKVILNTTDAAIEEAAPICFRNAKLSLGKSMNLAWDTIRSQKKRFAVAAVLSAVALLLFGILDTLRTFDLQTALVDSMQDETVLPVKKEKQLEEMWGKDGFLLKEEDRNTLQSRTGATFKGVYLPVLESMNVEENYGRQNEETRTSLSYVEELSGFMELTEEDAERFGVKLVAGAYPDGQQNQIAISSYLYEAFCLAGYQEYEGPVYSVFDGTGKNIGDYRVGEVPKELLDQTAFEEDGTYPGGQASWVWKNGSTSEITKPEDLLGKSVFLAGVNYTITGILDTGFDKMLYKDLEGTVEEDADALQTILWNRFRQERKQGLHCLAFVGAGAVERLAETYPQVISTEGMEANLIYGDVTLPIRHIGRYSDFVKFQSKATIPWGNYEDVNETPRKELKDQEFVFPVVYKETDGILDTTTSLGLPELYPEGTYRLQSYGDFQIQVTYEDGHGTCGGNAFRMVGRMQGNPVDYCGYWDTLLVSDAFFEQISEGREGLYAFAIGALPKETKERAELIHACYGEQGGIRFAYAGAMSTELESIEKTMGSFSGIFTIVSIVLGLFALFVFYQFMVTSMDAKKREIGIMRSMGATKMDIYRIFGLESGLAAVVMFVLGTLLTVLCVTIGNGALQDQIGIGSTVLHFGFRQILILLICAFLGVLVAGILPIRRMMKKKPVELIRDL